MTVPSIVALVTDQQVVAPRAAGLGVITELLDGVPASAGGGVLLLVLLLRPISIAYMAVLRLAAQFHV